MLVSDANGANNVRITSNQTIQSHHRCIFYSHVPHSYSAEELSQGRERLAA